MFQVFCPEHIMKEIMDEMYGGEYDELLVAALQAHI